MEIKLHSNKDLDIVLAALYGQPAKGLETLRLVDKVLGAVEAIADVVYDENGNVIQWKRDESGNLVFDPTGKPVRATRLREAPATLRLEKAHASFLRARLNSLDWNAQVARDVLRLHNELDTGEETGESKSESA